MRRGARIGMAALAAAASAPVLAGGAVSIDVPAGALSECLPLLARQAGVSISVASSALWQQPVRGVRGTLPPEQALARLLEGTPGKAVRVGATAWRIERAAAPARTAARAPVPPRASPPPPAAPHPDEAAAPIIVTAGKMDQRAADFIGTAHLLYGGDLAFGGERGSESLLARLSTLTSTHQGSGRNKLFIRGIADSSFTGPTQATVGQYLGDLRLTYNAPDPDLRLIDIARVEVLEGAQGTLYGAGSLAGIIRLVPNAPDPSGRHIAVRAGLSLTEGGDPGGDMTLTANLPIRGGHALRASAWGISEGGYIDNPVRGTNNINRSRIGGGRAALALDMGGGWTVEVGGIHQAIRLADAQYADRDGPPLSRASPVVEASAADFTLISLVIDKAFDGVRFRSSTGYVRHGVDEQFNATRAGQTPRLMVQDNRTRMLSNETRLWRPMRNGLGWVAGFSATHNDSTLSRRFTQPGQTSAVPVPGTGSNMPVPGTGSNMPVPGTGSNMPVPGTGASNRIREYTLYAKATVEPLEGLQLGGGGRFTHSRISGESDSAPVAMRIAGTAITAARSGQEWLPAAEALLRIDDRLSAFVRYEESFRPGGLAIERDFVRRFRPDRIASAEVGLRWSAPGLSANLSVSHHDWRDIQADFIDGNGFPTTANIGNGRITSVAGALSWRPDPAVRVEAGAVWNHSRVVALSHEAALFAAAAFLPSSGTGMLPTAGRPLDPGVSGSFGAGAGLGRIPNVADHAVHLGVDYRTRLGARPLRLAAHAKYLGPSRLGIGPYLGDAQGDYLDSSLAARLGTDSAGISLTLSNVANSRGNRFALGTPFDTSPGLFITPQRPRTLTIALDRSF